MSDDDRRPDPDALLAEAAKAGKGRLKVFLGMSPGVGKTYDMLRAARRRKAEGGDVLIGVVETHGRRETEALLRDMEVLPRKPVAHGERTYLEFDIDAALARKPDLLLVDEYAHSNAPTSRHPKRWQDVAELLAAGIDVWTTLNVQHLESLVDVVWKITGVRQRETVPDSALSIADEIELVDITPSELRQRLADGKVYMPETARLASEKFFRVENLTALRELALRRAAQTVDDQLVGAMKRAGVEGPWAAGERILVLIGGDGMAAGLVRAGRRLSDMMMDAPWIVAHVERPNAPVLDAVAAAQLDQGLKLADQLGASTVVLTGDDLVQSALDHARRNNVTQIVVGKSQQTRRQLAFWRPTLAEAFLKSAGGAALHVVTETASAEPPPKVARRRDASLTDWRGYLASMGLVGLAGAVAAVVDQMAEQANLAMVFLLAVLISGLGFGFWPAVAAAAVSAVAYNFFFLEPRLSLYIGQPTDVFTFFVFFAVALTTGWLTGRVRGQQRDTSRRASAISALLAASRRLSSVADQVDATRALAEQLCGATGGPAAVFLPEGDDIAAVAGAPTLEPFGATDMAAARWAWERGEIAGYKTGTLPNAGWVFYPLQGLKGRAGVAAVAPVPAGTGADDRFILALLDQGAVALERAELAAVAADAEALRRSDRLRSALLNSISHDLRTPLSTVLGSATTLIEYGAGLDKAVRRDLLDSIREEAERLSRYVGDLLDMTRLEGGALNTRKDWLDVRDVLAAAQDRLARRLAGRTLTRDFPTELSMVKADPALLEQALVNILENAVTHGAEDGRTELAAYEDRTNVVIAIEDDGPGIPSADLERVFEKFRRLEEPTDRGGERAKGAGLGLAIAKGFVEAMGGRIAASSPVRDGRGTRILISLPKETATHEFLL